MRVPNSRLSSAGSVSICEPAPEPPTMNSLSSMSCQVAMPAVCQATQMPREVAMLPIQPIWRGSNAAPRMP